MRARWQPIAILGSSLLLLAVVGAGMWAHWTRPVAVRTGQISRAQLAAMDPVAQWWTSRPAVVTPDETGIAVAGWELAVVPVPDLAPELQQVWQRVRQHEQSRISALPRTPGGLPGQTGFRSELRTLAAEYLTMSAARDHLAATHYWQTIDDWWRVYPQAEVMPRLAEAHRAHVLATVPRDEITPSHLQLSEVLARQQRRRGWSAAAEVEAIRTAFRETLEADLARFDADWDVRLDARLAALELAAQGLHENGRQEASQLLEAGAFLSPSTLPVALQQLYARHEEIATSGTAPASLLAVSEAEEAALAQFWQRYETLREHRMAAALRGQYLQEGTGADVTSQIQGLLFPEAAPETTGVSTS